MVVDEMSGVGVRREYHHDGDNPDAKEACKQFFVSYAKAFLERARLEGKDV